MGPETQSSSAPAESSTAPTYAVPQARIVVEHKVGDGLIKLDGRTHTLPEPVVGVSLRPNDPLAKKVASTGVETRNVLVRITVPKRTGRKRKRGSDEPFAYPDHLATASASIKAPELLQRMRDNEQKYFIEPLGMIPETHRFRAQPDFQMHSAELPVMQQLKNHVLGRSYDELKNFTIDLKTASDDLTEVPLPPNFINSDQPFKYGYQQADGVVYEFDEHGNETARNTQVRERTQIASIAADAPDVPTGPPPGLQLTEVFGTKLTQCIADVKALLEKRPVVTRRAMANQLPEYYDTILKEATQFAGYMFSAGPWRDSLIKYGVDPRSDPKYRIYQTLVFALEKEVYKPDKRPTNKKARLKAKDTHIFDGRSIASNVKTFTVCDIHDPLLKQLLEADDPSNVCDPLMSGWYQQGTIAKARVIMRDKAKCLLLGEEPPEDDYKIIVGLPNVITETNAAATKLESAKYSKKVVELAREYRAISKNYVSQRRAKIRQMESLGPSTPADGVVFEGRMGRMKSVSSILQVDGAGDADADVAEVDVVDGNGDFEGNDGLDDKVEDDSGAAAAEVEMDDEAEVATDVQIDPSLLEPAIEEL